MALAAARADAETYKALDTAADAARARGAPAAAAELIELAISLGGDKPSRRIRAAEHHFKAGDADRARTLLESTIDELRPGLLRGIALNLLAGIRIYDDTFVEGAAILKRALEDADANPALPIQTLLSLAFAQGMSGEFDDSLGNAREAVAHAEQLGYPPLISRALAMLVNTAFLYGHGVDEANLQRALELEDIDRRRPDPVLRQRRQRVDLRMDGTAEHSGPADGSCPRPMRRTRGRERHDGRHRVLHTDRDLARQLRRGCSVGRRHDGTRGAGRRFADDRADSARRGGRLRRP